MQIFLHLAVDGTVVAKFQLMRMTLKKLKILNKYLYAHNRAMGS